MIKAIAFTPFVFAVANALKTYVHLATPVAENVQVLKAEIQLPALEIVEDFFTSPYVFDFPAIAPILAFEQEQQHFFDCASLCSFHSCGVFESQCVALPAFGSFSVCSHFRQMNGLPVLCKAEKKEEKKVEVVAVAAPRMVEIVQPRAVPMFNVVEQVYRPLPSASLYFGYETRPFGVMRTVRQKAMTLVARPALVTRVHHVKTVVRQAPAAADVIINNFPTFRRFAHDDFFNKEITIKRTVPAVRPRVFEVTRTVFPRRTFAMATVARRTYAVRSPAVYAATFARRVAPATLVMRTGVRNFGGVRTFGAVRTFAAARTFGGRFF